MKIIVTGATGFIGTALCRELLAAGHQVIAVIRPNSTKIKKLEFEESWVNNLSILELPLDKLADMSQLIPSADICYHLAWNGSSGADREDFDIQYSNIQYTANAIRGAAACGCRKFIGAGSQAEYGVVQGKAIENQTVANPFMMYGAAKHSAFQMGRLLADQLGIQLVWPRIYSVYGVGENPGTLVNYVIDTLRQGGTPQLSPCENMWNFMYITDCAKALRILGETPETHGVYHIASEDTRVLKSFVEEIRDIVAPDAALNFGAKEADPARTFWLEPSTARIDALDRKNAVPFSEGIQRKLKRMR